MVITQRRQAVTGTHSADCCRFRLADSLALHLACLPRSLTPKQVRDNSLLFLALLGGMWQIRRVLAFLLGLGGLSTWSCRLRSGRIPISWGNRLLWGLRANGGRSPAWRTSGWPESNPCRKCWISRSLAPLGWGIYWWRWEVESRVSRFVL